VNQLFDAIEARFVTDALPTLTEYVTIPCLSPAFDPEWSRTGAIDDAVELFARWAEQRRIPGLSVSIRRLEGRTPALVIDVPATPGVPGTALLYGHLDKQPPLGEWSTGLAPFTPVRREEILYGRGTADDGYALFSALGAIESLCDRDLPHARCVVIIEASEESGSPDLEAHLDALGSELGDVDLVLCLDSGALDYDRLWVTTSLRGNLVVTVRVDVLDHGVHSGEASGVVPSSFRILRQLLDRIEDPVTGEILLDELSARPPASALAAAAHLSAELDDPLARHFPVVDGLELMGRDGAERLIRQSWSAALSVTGMDGIPSVAEGGNVLRASTTAKLSLRLPPNVDAVAAQEALVRALRIEPPSNARIHVEAEQPAQGWLAKEPERWLSDAVVEGSLDGFSHPPGFLGEGGSIPFLASLGQRFPAAEFLAVGVLGPGSNAHGIDEALHLPTVYGVTAAMARVLSAHALAERSAP
jgi:acetylornithine deacetylase/succinyl-diaminopimelate desuccinylase-like protein